jgi:hypothetical protein
LLAGAVGRAGQAVFGEEGVAQAVATESRLGPADTIARTVSAVFARIASSIVVAALDARSCHASLTRRANERVIEAAEQPIAGIDGAGVAVVAVDRNAEAAIHRVTGVGGTSVPVIAADRRAHASTV